MRVNEHSRREKTLRLNSREKEGGRGALGRPAFPSPLASAAYSLQASRNKSVVQHQGLPGHLEDQRHPWSEEDEEEEEEEEEEELLLASEMDFPPENRVFAPPASPSLIPQPALELKRTFREALQTAVASRAQQQQHRRWRMF